MWQRDEKKEEKKNKFLCEKIESENCTDKVKGFIAL